MLKGNMAKNKDGARRPVMEVWVGDTRHLCRGVAVKGDGWFKANETLESVRFYTEAEVELLEIELIT